MINGRYWALAYTSIDNPKPIIILSYRWHVLSMDFKNSTCYFEDKKYFGVRFLPDELYKELDKHILDLLISTIEPVSIKNQSIEPAPPTSKSLSEKSLKRLEDLTKYFEEQIAWDKSKTKNINEDGVYIFSCTIPELFEELKKWEQLLLSQNKRKSTESDWQTKGIDKKMWNSDQRKLICDGYSRGNAPKSKKNLSKEK